MLQDLPNYAGVLFEFISMPTMRFLLQAMQWTWFDLMYRMLFRFYTQRRLMQHLNCDHSSKFRIFLDFYNGWFMDIQRIDLQNLRDIYYDRGICCAYPEQRLG